MAKLKLWVRNLIIILALVVSLAGVGIGLYFILRPENDNPNPDGPADRVLSQEQKEYINGVSNIEQPSVDISPYDGIVLEDGTAIDTDRIIMANGNYLVVENATTLLPEFYVFSEQTSTPSSLSSISLAEQTADENLVLKKLVINSVYTHVMYLSGDYAIVANSSTGLDQKVVSLKTGDVVLTEDKFNDIFVNDDATQSGGRYVGSYFLSLSKFIGNFMLVEKQIVTDYDADAFTIDYDYQYLLYPLDNPNAVITFDKDFGYLVTYNFTEDYVVLVTTKHTYVYSTTLSQTGEFVSVLPILDNNFTEATGEDVQVESMYGSFKDVVYYTVQTMPNGLVLVEKNTVENEETIVESNYNVAYKQDLLDSEGFIAGINYSIYDTTNNQYLQNIPNFVGKVQVLQSKVDGYYILQQTYGGFYNAYQNGSSYAYVYDSNFNYVLKYNNTAYGDIIYYNGSHFITFGGDSSTILNAWGEKDDPHVGYTIVSSGAYDGYVVVKNDKYYSLYNTVTGQIFSDKYLFISEIMNGKVFAFKEETGYFEISLNTMLRTPIYSFDTTSINGSYSLNLAMGSVGYYFTYAPISLYTYVGFNGVTYKNISSFKYKIINQKVYLTLYFSNGTSKLLVSNYMSEITSLTAEEIASIYSYNQTPPTTGAMAVAEPLSITNLTSSSADLGNIDKWTTSRWSGISFADGVKIKVSTAETGVPTYSIEIYSDLINYNSNNYTEKTIKYGNESYYYKVLEQEDEDYGLQISKFRSAYKDEDGNTIYGINFNDTGIYSSDTYEYQAGMGAYYGLQEWWKKYYGSYNAPFPLPAGINTSTTSYKYLIYGENKSYSTERLGPGVSIIGAIACKTPYGFVITVRYGYASYYNAKLIYADRVVVGLDKDVYVGKNAIISTTVLYGNRSDGGANMYTVVGSSSEYRSSKMDYPSLTYNSSANDYPVLDLLWGRDSVTTSGELANIEVKKNDPKVSYSDILSAGVVLPDQFAMTYSHVDQSGNTEYNPYWVGVYGNTEVLTSTMYCDVTNKNWEADYRYSKNSGTCVNVYLEFTPFMSEFDRDYGELSFSESQAKSANVNDRTVKYGGYLNDEGERQEGLLIATSSKIPNDSEEHDASHSNYLTFSLNSYVFSKIDIKKLTLNLDGYDDESFSNIYSSKDCISHANEQWCINIFLGSHTHYLLHPTIKQLLVTYKIEEDNYQWHGTIQVAKADENIGVDTGETLFVAETPYTQIKYGFWQTANYGGVIGAPRKDLSDFTQKCTFGYKLNGLKAEGTEYFDADGIIINFGHLYSTGISYNFTPSQTPLNLNLKYHYIRLNYVSENKLAESSDDVNTNDNNLVSVSGSRVTYNREIDLLSIKAPIGYLFKGWVVPKETYTVFDGLTSKTATGAKELGTGTTTIYKYFALCEKDLTLNSDAMAIDGDLTLNLYAIYEPKEYKLQIDVRQEGQSNARNLYVYKNDGSVEVIEDCIWTSDVIKYSDDIELPLMYVREGDIYYKVELKALVGSSVRDLSTGTADRQFNVNAVSTDNQDFTDYINDGANAFNSCSTDNPINLNAVLTPMEYTVKYNSTQDSHVYSNADYDNVSEKLEVVDSIKVQEYITTSEIVSSGNLEDYLNLKSGLNYCLTFENFKQGLRLKLTYTINFLHEEDIPTTYVLYFNYYDDLANYTDAKGFTHTYYYQDGSRTGYLASTNENFPFKASMQYDSTNAVLKVYLYNIGGGIFTGIFTNDNDSGVGSFDGKITLDAEIDSQLYNVNITKQENKEGAEPEDSGLGETKFSLSDQINYPDISGTAAHRHDDADLTQSVHYYSYGSTMLISTGASMYEKLHGSIYVPNQFLSGLKISYEDEEFFAWDYNEKLDEMARKEFTQLFIQFAEDPTKIGDYLFYNRTASPIEYSKTTLLLGDYYEQLLQIMYGINPREDINYTNCISDSMTVYYKVVPLTSGDTTVYLILTYHENSEGISLGVSSAVLYTLQDTYVLDSDNTYNFTLLYTNYDGVLTWNAQNIGAADSSDFDTTYYTKSYLTAYDNNKEVFQTDGNGNYIEILGKKVYVTIDNANDNRLVVDKQKTDAFDELFGTNGKVKNNYETDTGYLFNYISNNNDPGGNVSVVLDFDNSYYADETKLDRNSNPPFNFASVSPANSFTYNISVKNGYYINKVTIDYNEKIYTIEFDGFFIDYDQQWIIPKYKITISDAKTGEVERVVYSIEIEDIDDAGKLANIIAGKLLTTTLENRMLNVSFAACNVSNANASMVMQIEIGFITDGANISVEYGAYSMLMTAFEDDNADSQNIAWDYADGEIKIYNNGSGSDKVVSYINFIDTTDAPNIPTRIYAVSSNKGLGLYSDLQQGPYWGGQRIYFIVLDYKLTHTNLESPKPEDLQTYTKVNTTIQEDALYELVIGDGLTNPTAKNKATWIYSDRDTQKTEQNIVNTNGANFIASYTIKSKEINTTITSDINFGTIEDDIVEESINTSLSTYLTTDKFYFINETGNGQIASNNTTLYAQQSGNFGDLSTVYYSCYGTSYKIQGNKLVYTIYSSYGYDFEGVNFNAKIDGEEAIVLALLTYQAEVTEAQQLVVKPADSEVEYIVGTYLIEEQDGNYILTIELTNAAIQNINVDIHYNAKEFTVIYDTDADFGTSLIQQEVQTRTFTYNVKANVNQGLSDAGVKYTRIGYDQIGWAFADFYKGVDGKTVNTTIDGLNSTELNSTNYLTQMYAISEDAGYNWYYSLGKEYGNVFGTTNAAGQSKEAGYITLSAIWQAKTYTINFDYNDVDNSLGSTTSTKYTATWVFDMPITVADVQSADLSFEKANFTQANTLINSISRVYRMGYEFVGWYFAEGTFNSATGWADDYLVYNSDKGGNEALVLALDTTAGKLGYPTDLETPTKVFGYQVYSAIKDTDSWAEVAGENTSSFNLYASWTANTYTFAHDLNAYSNIANSGANGNSSITWTSAPTTELTVNTLTGVGSSVASLDLAAAGVLSVVFDQNFNAQIMAYAYRNGYKFSGWFASRETLEEGDFGLLENSHLGLDLLLFMLNSNDELTAVQGKATQTFENTSIVETVKCDGATISSDSIDGVEYSGWGNIMLLHARWEALPYTINIDLNNWNHPDYAWADGDYIVDDLELVENNVVSNVQLVVYFDQPFNTCELYIDGAKVEQNQQIEIVRNGNTYVTTGETGYEKLIQIITAYGYKLENTGYNFTLKADGNGTVLYNDFSIKIDSIFNETMFNNAYYFDDHQSENASASNITTKLTSLDYSGDYGFGDRHKVNINDTSKFGTRTFTLFAYWTAKNVAVSNIGTREEYGNTLDGNNTYQTIFYNPDSSAIISWGKDANTSSNTYYGSVYNNEYTYYIAPATGQYIEKLTIEFGDNYNTLDLDGNISNQLRGYITLEFKWDSVTHLVTITSATYSVGYINTSGKYQETTTGNFTISADGRSINKDTKLNYLFESINISTSKYQVVTTQNEKNINDTYADYSEKAQNWLTEANLKDVNFIAVEIAGVKSNMIVTTQTKAQTYQVDYYRYVRPFDGMQTHIDEDTESENYGQEVWDSEFLNDWDQYQVYKTVTYRYGEYINTSYGYATNFGFGGWYYYQGHISNFQEYANYGSPDYVFETHESQNITNGLILYDFLGLWGTDNSEDEYLEYVWDSAQKKYVCTTNNSLMIDGAPVYDNDVLVGYERFSYTDDNGDIQYRDSITVRSYTYYEDYSDYKFDSAAISGNVSLVAVYFPASIHKVHYYTWKDSSSTTAGYEERNASSNEYVLGEKHVASVVADNSGLSRSFSYIEYWELGTNTEYYRVGFSGFNNVEGGMPTEMSALEFLMQFINPGNYTGYEENFNTETQKLTIEYSDLVRIINTTYGINVSGDNVKELAVSLLKYLLITGDYQVYNYLDNFEVLSNMDIKKFTPVAATFDEYGKQTNYGENIRNLYRTKVGVVANSVSPQDIYADIIEELNVDQLLVLLDNIAIDYFGYVLINPSANIGYWPQGTYLAGWYMIQEDLRKLLMGEDTSTYYNYVLTFNSDTFVAGTADDELKCMYIVDTTEDHLGNKTYYVAFSKDAGAPTYQITKFNTVDPITGSVDILSRVDTSVHIFAAYNTYKFEMTTNGVTNVDIQWGTDVLDLNGLPYQYTASDVYYVALTEDQLLELEKDFSTNGTIPTALQTVISRNSATVNVTNNFETAVSAEGKYIIAFVYNIERVYKENQADGSVVQKVEYNEHINTVATMCLNKDNAVVEDLLSLLLD